MTTTNFPTVLDAAPRLETRSPRSLGASPPHAEVPYREVLARTLRRTTPEKISTEEEAVSEPTALEREPTAEIETASLPDSYREQSKDPEATEARASATEPADKPVKTEQPSPQVDATAKQPESNSDLHLADSKESQQPLPPAHLELPQSVSNGTGGEQILSSNEQLTNTESVTPPQHLFAVNEQPATENLPTLDSTVSETALAGIGETVVDEVTSTETVSAEEITANPTNDVDSHSTPEKVAPAVKTVDQNVNPTVNPVGGNEKNATQPPSETARANVPQQNDGIASAAGDSSQTDSQNDSTGQEFGRNGQGTPNLVTPNTNQSAELSASSSVSAPSAVATETTTLNTPEVTEAVPLQQAESSHRNIQETDFGTLTATNEAHAKGLTGAQADKGTAQITPQEFIERITNAVRQAQQNGGHLKVRLHPPELGIVQIDVSMQDGVMTARLDVETAAAQKAINEHIALLRDALSQGANPVERIEVQLVDGDQLRDEFSEEREQAGGEESPHHNSQQSADHSNEDQQGEPEAEEPSHPAARLVSQVMDRLDIEI